MILNMLHLFRLKTLLLFCISTTSISGEEKFHKKLESEDLKHYFGTNQEYEIPVYNFVPVQQVGSRQYHVTALGEKYHMVLQPNEHLIAPGCETVYKYANGTEERKSCHSSDNCHYHGYLANRNESSVAVSTCDGIRGVISVPDHDLYIQPLKQHHLNLVNDTVTSPRPHLVYRRQAKNQFCAHAEVLDSSSEPELGHSRQKRSTREHLEMRVVVAPDSQKYHGGDTERFVTTVMNMAAKLFMDSTLQHRLKVSLVELTVLMHDQNNLRIQADSGRLLKSFVEWHKTHESNNKMSDGALLITKTNLVHQGDDSNVGLGNMDAVCTSYKCSVNEDTGLDTALTIAHETGHTLGMLHDGDSNSCPGGKFIMSPGGAYGPTAAKWSSCSANYLQKFLSSSKAKCLENTPSGNAIHLYSNNQKPGVFYSADAQCSLMYGEETQACHMQGKECINHCLQPPNRNALRLCMDFGSFRADGTECSTGKWCINGQCIAYGNNGPRAINGGWSNYDKDWSVCSRSCGGGVKVKTRKCNNPSPRFGGRDCVGEEFLAKICNVQPCGKSELDFKNQQCSATNDQYHYTVYDRARGDDQCRLKCIRTENGMIYDRGEQFVDGTECTTDSAYISKCVQGKCKSFGCDGHLGSQVKFDNCGECGGTGRRCNPHSGTYDQGKAKAYVTFLTVPRGATSITVTNSNIYCHMSVVVGGRRLFSQQGLSASGTYTGNGVAVQYRRSGPEKIHIIGPTTQSVQIQVYRSYDDSYMGVKPEIKYTYYVPTQSQVPSSYRWQTKTSSCSKTCGTGKSVVMAICVQKSNNQEVADAKCNLYQKPAETVRDCNTNACPPEWHAYDWGACSKSCGGGVQTRRVACVTIQRDHYTPVAENRCNAGRKPSSTRRCGTQQCAGVWKASAWSACSETCAYGVRTRTVKCYKTQNSNQPISDSVCNQSQKPTTTEKCLARPCDTKTSGSACKDDIGNCKEYGEDSCRGQYRHWAEANCALHCGFCVKNPSSYQSSQSSVDPDCKDTVTCSDYGEHVCTEYAGWSSTHCRKHCNLCGSKSGTSSSGSGSSSSSSSSSSQSSSSGDCKDKVDCKAYGNNVCTEYAGWARVNCPKTCNLCGAGSSSVNTGSSSNVGNTGTSNIPSSDPCRDKVKCEEYGKDVCTAYADWSHKNCARHCKFCQPCTDAINDCAAYGKSACTGDYLAWAKQHCKAYCNLCGSRRKRDISSFESFAVPKKMSSGLEIPERKAFPEYPEVEIPVPEIVSVDLGEIKKLEEKLEKNDDEADLQSMQEMREMNAENMAIEGSDAVEDTESPLPELDEEEPNLGEESVRRDDPKVPDVESGRVPVAVMSDKQLVDVLESLHAQESDTPPPPPPLKLPTGNQEHDSDKERSEDSGRWLAPKPVTTKGAKRDEDKQRLMEEIDKLKEAEN